MADPILDRLLYNSHKLNVSGESMRKSHRQNAFRTLRVTGGTVILIPISTFCSWNTCSEMLLIRLSETPTTMTVIPPFSSRMDSYILHQLSTWRPWNSTGRRSPSRPYGQSLSIIRVE
nr:hypothetical protein [Marinobacter sp. HL-58]